MWYNEKEKGGKMSTFQQVLADFEHYLAEDDFCQVSPQGNGYLVTFGTEDDEGLELTQCSTPDELERLLTRYCEEYRAYQALAESPQGSML